MYICLGKVCSFDINNLKKKAKKTQGQSGLMVMTPDFHPGDPGLIPFVGDKSFLIFIHIFNLVPNSLTAGYYNFQHSVRLLIWMAPSRINIKTEINYVVGFPL
jgi:hypothetical protein